ncbi:hypothetical protein NZD88_08890 [Chryseobacterium antibioticum]|uniref:Uncharacterized protein n=1 Tax=Chryseobacterium pyrolae TaxID=2987481 RepID=A0ABT2IG84_9FLAO|nr:hypothetical protein [Chryseobacterium pyrolae]MCT2407651.1 hypothetical protein [Chryseobacterium pyrolae]
MGKKYSEKAFKKLIQKHIDATDFVKIYLDDDSAISGFLVKFSDDFVMIEETNDFALTGTKIVPYDRVRSIRNNGYDDVSKAIYLNENLICFNQKIIDKTHLENSESLFKSIKKQGYHCIIESQKNKKNLFSIGEILEVNAKSVMINNYDPAGRINKKPRKISFKDIDLINFNDNYSKVFRKYLK